MRNGLVQLGAWAAATGAAVALSWLGVHAVLTGAAFERPKALPLPSPAAARASAEKSAVALQTTAGAPATTPASTPTPTPTPSPSPSHGATTPRPASASSSPSPRRATPSSTVHSYLMPGGRVALDLQPASAELVSATPEAGWQMQVWHGDRWMRIDFSREGTVNSVFVTWNDHEPDVQIVVP
ncbi:hypothetical protein [Kitasatospora sp. NPDC057223]|uniref:hypothetical protein n=1 Tax=Kitasatospora sp. NPDC057223 TaxID=3346055 RepID=UPI00362E9250